MAANNLLGKTIIREQIGNILMDTYGDILCFASDSQTVPLEKIQYILNYPIIDPIYRISVLHDDETIDYIISNEDICDNGISFNEGYNNGMRRSITLKLINVSERSQNIKKWEDLHLEEQSMWNNDSTEYYKCNNQTHMKYMPSVDNLWYGKKVQYDIGFRWMGVPYYLSRGIYRISGFDISHSISERTIVYQLKDKFELYDGTTGTFSDGYEVPVDTPLDEVISSINNLSGTDGSVNDLKPCIVDSSFSGFKTQATIRVDAGGKMADVYNQLATQMSAEYYYNTVGNLTFTPKDESLNDVDKPIIWQYSKLDLEGISLKAEEELINVIKVVGDNVDGSIYSAVVKNENLNSPINIYYIKERVGPIIQNVNIFSDDMAEELGRYELRKKTMITLSQTLNVPFNPLLMVNNLIEIHNPDLNIDRKRFIINSISHTSGSATMSIEVVNIDELPMLGQVTN